MKSFFYVLLFLVPYASFSQDGLEGIFVEEYYVSDQADRAAFKSVGILEEGSTTYRIYVDLKPGYRLQAIYGSPEHPLYFKSTAPFYNHPEVGATHPNIIPERSLKKDIALLDSWFCVGASGENHMGVPRLIEGIENDSLLRLPAEFLNHTERKSKSLKEASGMVRVIKPAFPTFFQMDSCLKYLGAATLSDSLVIDNGAWASMGKGAVGLDSLNTNMILIAQLTTKGDLSFEINIQVGGPNNSIRKYVARNAGYKEFEHPSLIYTSPKKNKKKNKKKNTRHA